MALPINSEELYLMFGKKGSGKSCTLAKLASVALKKGMIVYSTIPIRGTFLFNAFDFGKFEFEPYSLILIDEVNMVWDNRNYKNFPQYTQDLFRTQRHFHLTIYMFSQSFDCDKKLRDLCDGLFLVKKICKYVSMLKTVDKDFIVTKPSDYGGSDISFGLFIRPFIVPGARHFVFLPKYWSMYDSFSKYELEDFNKYVNYVS